MSKQLFYSKVVLAACLLSTHFIEAAPVTRTVNSTSNNPATIGTLPYWLLNAADGDTIDCSAIAGQQITLTSSLPAITKSYTINGAGITIDGDNSYQAFQIAAGSVHINSINIQNAISQGGNGGDGYSGGGGGVAGGAALYIHGGTSVTLTDTTLFANTAQGGNGGAASNIGNTGAGGGGGFGGGEGGSSLTLVSTGGGGGGHSNGGNGGSNTLVTGASGVYFGGGGGGAGINSITPGGSGGNADPTGTFTGGAESAGNGGGGAGASENGFAASGSGGAGVPGNGGNGIGNDFLFGAGGGGGTSSETGFPGGSGVGAAGGGGGSNYSGGEGGILGGGGGGGIGGTGGNGGFGAGGGGAVTGGIGGGGFSAGGGNGGSDTSGNGGGGGGSGLGGAIFIQSDAELTIVDALGISGNTAIGGSLGATTSTDPNYIAPGNGAAMGQDIFMRQGSSLIFDVSSTVTVSTPIEADSASMPQNNSGSLIKRGSGILKLNGSNTYVGTTTLEEGTLQLDGSINTNLYIQISGTLSGDAVVEQDIYNNGAISISNPINTVLTTNLILSPTSIYKVGITPSSSSLIHATQEATLAGKMQVVQYPGSYPAKGQYTILTADNGISGSIDTLEVKGMPNFHFSLGRSTTTLYLNYVYLLPPASLRGKQITKKCHKHSKPVNVLKWDSASQGVGPAFYNVYRNDLNTLIGVVLANDKMKFRDCACSKHETYTYYIEAVDQQNIASSPASITIRPRK